LKKPKKKQTKWPAKKDKKLGREPERTAVLEGVVLLERRKTNDAEKKKRLNVKNLDAQGKKASSQDERRPHGHRSKPSIPGVSPEKRSGVAQPDRGGLGRPKGRQGKAGNGEQMRRRACVGEKFAPPFSKNSTKEKVMLQNLRKHAGPVVV